MFTGIVTDIGEILDVRPLDGDGARLSVSTGYDTGPIDIGASVACSGVCLTVVDKAPGRLDFDASRETLSRTTLGDWRKGTRINLERSLRLGDELGGHLVFGHVDGVGRLVASEAAGEGARLVFAAPHGLERFVAEKGSVAIDGVSLTVNGVSDDRFEVMVIPHTRAHTTLGDLATGGSVNVEVDMLARYVARLSQAAGA